MPTIIEHETQLEFPLDYAKLDHHLHIPADPESEFLHTVALNAYPILKTWYPDISIREIQGAAEEFRGAKVLNYIPILLVHAISEHRTPRLPRLDTSLQLSFPDITPATIGLTFFDRLKKPVQAAITKLKSIKIPFS